MPIGEKVDSGPRALHPGVIAGASIAVVLALYLIARAMATYSLPVMFLRTQDRWLLLAQSVIVALAWPRWWRGPRRLRVSAGVLVALTLGLIALDWAGRRWLLMGYNLSRDEQMADFDAWIFGHGRLAWPLLPGWHQDASALNLLFMLPVAHPLAWVSGYLPGNALLRGLFGLLGSAEATGPLLTGLSLPLVWSCARRLWPNDDEAVAVPVILLMLSGQFVVTGMTAYAMPAHLFFNLSFLWLFLRDRRWSDAAALAVGFFATGLHQPLFHPLFVAPWLLLLARQARWRRLAGFLLGYGLICLFWLIWPHVIQNLVAGPWPAGESGVDFFARFAYVMRTNAENGPLMACNLLRFVAWQNPLMLVALIACWRLRLGDLRAEALGLGLILNVVAMAFIMPLQGHGFGYRYVHGLLGNVALLAGFLWHALGPTRDRVRPFAARVALLGVALLPLHLGMANRFYALYAGFDAVIAAAPADYALIDAGSGPFVQDLVLNRPDLSNRPLRLLANNIADTPLLARRLCHSGTAVVIATPSFFAPAATLFAEAPEPSTMARLDSQARDFTAAGCRVSLLASL